MIPAPRWGKNRGKNTFILLSFFWYWGQVPCVENCRIYARNTPSVGGKFRFSKSFIGWRMLKFPSCQEGKNSFVQSNIGKSGFDNWPAFFSLPKCWLPLVFPSPTCLFSGYVFQIPKPFLSFLLLVLALIFHLRYTFQKDTNSLGYKQPHCSSPSRYTSTR